MARSSTLTPLSTLHDESPGATLPLDDELHALYGGALRLSSPAARPYLVGNFVSTLDGVVSLGLPGTGGDEISGGSREDRFVMGLLRAAADAVIVGAGTLRSFPQHLWTPEAIYSPQAAAFAALRRSLGKPRVPPTALVTASGNVDLSLPLFTATDPPAIVITTDAGARALGARGDHGVRVVAAGSGTSLRAAEILAALAPAPGALVLLECGPTLMGRFFEDRAADELFLTVAPQIAGHDEAGIRQGVVAHALFLPHQPLWGELLSVKRCGGVLFLRYRFETEPGDRAVR